MLEKELKLDLGIKGKKALVCASSKGLGLGCAVALAEAGVDLVINSRDPKNLEIAANLLRNNYQMMRLCHRSFYCLCTVNTGICVNI